MCNDPKSTKESIETKLKEFENIDIENKTYQEKGEEAFETFEKEVEAVPKISPSVERRTNANLVIDCLINQCKKNNTSLFLVTHNESILSKFDRVLHLENGTIS